MGGAVARRWLGIATVAVVVAAGAVLGVAAPASAAPADTIYSLVNQARAAQGLPGLLRNSAIDGVALNWANQMAANGAMTHNPSYSSQLPGGWSRAAENVASRYPSPEAAFNGWMNSPGHRANILGDFTDIGIAFISANGTTWAVQDFGKYAGHAGPPAPAPAPKPAPPAPAPVPAPAPQPPPSAAPSATPTAPSPSATPAPPPAPTRAAATPLPRVSGEPPVLPKMMAAAAAVVLIGAAFALTLRRRRHHT